MDLLALQYQINSAINSCQGRISCGTDVDKAFEWLQEETDQIFKGDIIYEEN